VIGAIHVVGSCSDKHVTLCWVDVGCGWIVELLKGSSIVEGLRRLSTGITNVGLLRLRQSATYHEAGCRQARTCCLRASRCRRKRWSAPHGRQEGPRLLRCCVQCCTCSCASLAWLQRRLAEAASLQRDTGVTCQCMSVGGSTCTVWLTPARQPKPQPMDARARGGSAGKQVHSNQASAAAHGFSSDSRVHLPCT
jgi:hypothetical protein